VVFGAVLVSAVSGLSFLENYAREGDSPVKPKPFA